MRYSPAPRGIKEKLLEKKRELIMEKAIKKDGGYCSECGQADNDLLFFEQAGEMKHVCPFCLNSTKGGEKNVDFKSK